MDAQTLYEVLRISFTVLGSLVFLSIALWAFWPSRRDEMNRNARIPLSDDA
jgi:cbb3-type cytochrome oxidase subunit 3